MLEPRGLLAPGAPAGKSCQRRRAGVRSEKAGREQIDCFLKNSRRAPSILPSDFFLETRGKESQGRMMTYGRGEDGVMCQDFLARPLKFT